VATTCNYLLEKRLAKGLHNIRGCGLIFLLHSLAADTDTDTLRTIHRMITTIFENLFRLKERASMPADNSSGILFLFSYFFSVIFVFVVVVVAQRLSDIISLIRYFYFKQTGTYPLSLSFLCIIFHNFSYYDNFAGEKI